MEAFTSNKPRLFTSRFTNETWNQNQKYKEKIGWKGSLYGAPRRVKQSLPLNRFMFVLEMNNDTNQTSKLRWPPPHQPSRLIRPSPASSAILHRLRTNERTKTQTCNQPSRNIYKASNK